MANDYKKLQLSSAPANGRGILIAATGTPGTLIHTADADNTGNIMDEVWLYAYNHDTAAILLTIEFGGVTVPDDLVKVTIPPQSGVMLIVPGFPLNNAKLVRAWAGTTNKIVITGYVNKITHS